MINKFTKIILPVFIALSLVVGSPVGVVHAATTVKTTTSAKKVAKKPVAKKKVVKKKKERLIAEPALFTLETAPHSPKPVAKSKKKTIKKVVVKKKA
jgi:hypothetical protein